MISFEKKTSRKGIPYFISTCKQWHARKQPRGRFVLSRFPGRSLDASVYLVDGHDIADVAIFANTLTIAEEGGLVCS